MAKQLIIDDLKVIPIYQALMKASTEDDSVYMKAKDTIKELVVDNIKLSDTVKVSTIVETLTSMTSAITSQALQAAIKIATENRDAPYVLTKIKWDTDLVEQQVKNAGLQEKELEAKILSIAADKDYKVIQGWNTQANMFRDTGFNSSNLTTATPVLDHFGTKTETGNKLLEGKGLEAATYNKWATSLMQNGKVDFIVDSVGMPTNVLLSTEGMTQAQIKVTDRQRLAFDDNMRQHVLNGSASMLGVMIGSDTFTEASAYTRFLDKWDGAATFLNTNHSGTAGTIVADFGTLGIGEPLTITGSVINIPAGTSITTRFSATNVVDGGAAIVQADLTWAITIPGSTTEDIDGSPVTIIAEVKDGLGRIIQDIDVQTV